MRGSILSRMGLCVCFTGIMGFCTPAAAQRLDRHWKVGRIDRLDLHVMDYMDVRVHIDQGYAKHKSSIYWSPLNLVRIENLSNSPVCAAVYYTFAFKMSNYHAMFNGGNGAAYYIKPHATQQSAAYLIYAPPVTTSFGFAKMVGHSWWPLAKNKCGPDPIGVPNLEAN